MVLEAMAKMVPESVELVTQDEAIEATSTAKSSTSEEEVAAPTVEDVGDAAEKNDAQRENAPAIAPTEGRDREQLPVEAAPEEVQVEASAREAEPQT
ncbi:hypothetical protein V6N13_027577 [Hibiscus sabdariffa]